MNSTTLKMKAQRRAKSLRNLARDLSTTEAERALAQARMNEICLQYGIDPECLDDVVMPKRASACPARLNSQLARLRDRVQHIKLQSLLHDRREDYALIFAGLERAIEIAEDQAKRLRRPTQIGSIRRPKKGQKVNDMRRKYL
jgi:hypothetical protein